MITLYFIDITETEKILDEYNNAKTSITETVSN